MDRIIVDNVLKYQVPGFVQEACVWRKGGEEQWREGRKQTEGESSSPAATQAPRGGRDATPAQTRLQPPDLSRVV